MGHFLYSRHFLLLTVCGAFMALLGMWFPIANLPLAFAIYGTIHAAALMLSARKNLSARAKILFIAVAAGLCVMTVRAGLLGTRLSGAIPGTLGLYCLLGLSTMIGSVAYGMAIRLFALAALTFLAIASISAACALATVTAAVAAGHVGHLGPWELAVPWWYVFSYGLWYFDRPRSRQ
jgi:hypothetical protein